MGQVHGVPSIGFPYCGIIGNRGPVHLYHESPHALLTAYLNVVLALHRLRPLVLRVFRFLLLRAPLWRHLPLFQLLRWSFLFWVRIDSRTLINRRRRRGKRKVGRGLGLRSFRWSCSLTLVSDQTLKLGLFLRSVTSASSKLFQRKQRSVLANEL